MKNSIIAQVVGFEEDFNQFEKLGGKLTDEMLSAFEGSPQPSLTETTSYAKIREVIQAYDTATTKWTSSTIFTFPLQLGGGSTGAAPMEADRAKGGKNGGKGFQKRKPGQAKGRHQDLWRQERGQR